MDVIPNEHFEHVQGFELEVEPSNLHILQISHKIYYFNNSKTISLNFEIFNSN